LIVADEPSAPALQLDDIRREIDRADDDILAALERRFAAVEEVRRVKANGGGGSPVRPAREALILRRLAESAHPRLSQRLRMSLWRAIIAESTLSQAPVRMHVSAGLFNSVTQRLLLRDYFGHTPVDSHPGEASALTAIARDANEIAVVALDSPWIDSFLEGRAGKATVIGCLPFLNSGKAPLLLIIGHAAPEATGADETLLITEGALPRDFTPAPLWQLKLGGGRRLTSLPGFLNEHNPPLVGLKRSNERLALTIIGRYPSPLEVRS
jgi:chorismate mutase